MLVLVPDYRNNTRHAGWQILLAVLFLHAGLYLLWPLLKTGLNEEKISAGSLIFLDLPIVAKPSVQEPDKKEAQRTAQPRSVSAPPANDHPRTATENTPEPVSPDIGVAPEPQAHPQPNSQPNFQSNASINRDVGEVFKGLKKDFQERERFASKANVDPIAKMGERIALSGTVNRVGVKHEVHILGDGRPVSKVITPFGTYCILHRKPGEIIGNELATVPVTCGNL
ncbi:hypothetical protein H8L32_09770 [Undibacterium sp. CY18W]|uniref:Uncharacterized protein n=1 Tax=Undibacterium hunanense TaxID=2762292 RepID=A0ABR6ZQ85_9BURK|nr:hypothetical protein [Undibacterium hunanense]MBC3917759.1 hypothetical protein [Undibacterium hunanense]